MSEFIFSRSLWGLSPWWLIGLCALAFAGFAFWRARRRFKIIPLIIIVGLRSVTMGLIVFLCFGPKWSEPARKIIKPEVTTLLDASKSMGARSTQDGPSRFAKTVDSVEDALKDGVFKGRAVHRAVFAKAITDLSPNQSYDPQAILGEATDLSMALESTLRNNPLCPGEVVLVSDGFWNAGFDPVTAAKRLREAGGTVHCLHPSVETSTRRVEAAVVLKSTDMTLTLCGDMLPRINERNTTWTPWVLVENRSGAPASFSVKTTFADVTREATINLQSGESRDFIQQNFPVPTQAGDYTVVCEIRQKGVENEKILKRVEQSIRVAPPERSKKHKNVLYVDGFMRAQYRWICDLLRLNSFFRLKGYMFVTGKRCLEALAKASTMDDYFAPDRLVWIKNAEKLNSAPRDEAIDKLLSKEKIISADILIVGFPTSIVKERSETIMNAIANGANALFFITPQTAPAVMASGLSSLLVESPDQLHGVVPAKKITVAKHPRTRMSPVAESESPLSLAIPKQLPLMQVYAFKNPNLVKGFKTLYSVKEVKEKDPATLPLVMMKSYGLGNVFLMMTDHFWHLKIGQNAKHARLYQEFYYRLLTHSIFETPSIRISTPTPFRRVDQTIELFIQTNDRSPKNLRNLRAEWTDLVGGATSLADMDFSKGNAVVRRRLEKPGPYKLIVRNADKNEIIASYRVVCLKEIDRMNREKPSEKPTLNVNLVALRTIAEAGGGLCLPLDQADRLREHLKERKVKTITVREEKKFVDAWFPLAGLLALLCLEWFVRRVQT